MFRIMASYNGLNAEEVDTCEDRKTAEYLIGEYRMAYGPNFRIWIIGPYIEA